MRGRKCPAVPGRPWRSAVLKGAEPRGSDAVRTDCALEHETASRPCTRLPSLRSPWQSRSYRLLTLRRLARLALPGAGDAGGGVPMRAGHLDNGDGCLGADRGCACSCAARANRPADCPGDRARSVARRKRSTETSSPSRHFQIWDGPWRSGASSPSVGAPHFTVDEHGRLSGRCSRSRRLTSRAAVTRVWAYAPGATRDVDGIAATGRLRDDRITRCRRLAAPASLRRIHG